MIHECSQPAWSPFVLESNALPNILSQGASQNPVSFRRLSPTLSSSWRWAWLPDGEWRAMVRTEVQHIETPLCSPGFASLAGQFQPWHSMGTCILFKGVPRLTWNSEMFHICELRLPLKLRLFRVSARIKDKNEYNGWKTYSLWNEKLT